MNILQLGLFSLTEALFSASPGPAVFMVISASMKSGIKAAMAATAGVLAGNLTYFALSSLILIFSLSINTLIFDGLRWFGVFYISYILWDQYKHIILTSKSNENGSSDIKGSTPDRNNGSYFVMAYIMQIANPKTIVFFTSFLPQFINKEEDLISQFIVLAILSIVVEFIVLMFYAKISSSVINKIKSDKTASYLEGIGNITMVLAVIWGIVLNK